MKDVFGSQQAKRRHLLFYIRRRRNKAGNSADYMLRVAETKPSGAAQIQIRLIPARSVQKLNLFATRLNEFCYLCSR